MSVNFIKSLVEAQEIKLQSYQSIGIEFNKKFTYFTFAKKFIDKQLSEKKKLIILNFDILFYKYLASISSNIPIKHCFSLKDFKFQKEYYTNIFSDIKNASVLIIGLDLLNESNIHNFILTTKNILPQATYSLFIYSTDNSSNNLTPEIEKKKNIIKKNLNYYLYEKNNKIYQNKNLLYIEIYNLGKLTKDIGIFEYNINSKKRLPVEIYEFEKISIYLKEYKDLFESSEAEEDKSLNTNQPISTFKLSLNDKELQAKNEVILPYLKTGKEKEENRIVIDQEDLNELYEEDPDGDLDI